MIIIMIFDMSISYFHKILFHYFEDYLLMKLTLYEIDIYQVRIKRSSFIPKNN